jgi:Na+-driven multidrug efflux pump
MYIQVLGAIMNAVLDPIFIYTLDMGVAGAAWATVAAFSISIITGLYWYLLKKDLFIRFRREHLKINVEYMKWILSVGLPQSLEFTVMNIFNVILNLCIIMIGTTDAMAIYTVAWRLVYILMIPAMAMGGAIVSSCSAEFGMKRYDMIRLAYRFSVKWSIIILTGLALAMVLLADPIATLFTGSEGLQHLHNEMKEILYIFAIFVPIMSMVFVGSSLLQALNRSKIALLSSFIRNIVLAGGFVTATYMIGTLTSLWWVMTLGELFGGALMGYWAYIVLREVAKRDGRYWKSDS